MPTSRRLYYILSFLCFSISHIWIVDGFSILPFHENKLPDVHLISRDNPNQDTHARSLGSLQSPDSNGLHSLKNVVMTCVSILTASVALPAFAVSGGGLDYANLDITGQNFSNDPKAYKGKDFTQVIAKGTNFSNSNLQGCRFYKAYLVNTNFEGADLRGASLEDTSLDGSNLKNAIVSGAYFSSSLLDVATAEGADFSDAQIPIKTLTSFCERRDVVKGTNPVTGVNTRDSLMCD